jgi:hypothetical protein
MTVGGSVNLQQLTLQHVIQTRLTVEKEDRLKEPESLSSCLNAALGKQSAKLDLY